MLKEAILNHIKRFPAVESHYCRANTNRVYLSEDLTFSKMYRMFCSEWNEPYKVPEFRIYLKLCKQQKISIHRPKKDQCSLCTSYRKGDDNTKEKLKETFDIHISEKTKVRQLKEECKQQGIDNPNTLCANFDLQQVIYLPISKDSQIFYKRRLSIFNFTFYNVASKECDCYLWHDGQSRRGSSEMSTAVFKALKFYDDAGVKKAYLFADGCGGQNKNSIFPGMMLSFIQNSTNLKEISLRYFVTSHGQCEGDSVHSTISQAINRSGDIFQPCQLEPIIHGARANPYRVHMLQSDMFIDFKTLAKDLRILDSRSEKVDWNQIMEVKVSADHTDKIFYKTSHLQSEFSEICLKRLSKPVCQYRPHQLNTEPPKISKSKYNDLMKLCNGDTAVVKDPIHKQFYFDLGHEDE